MIHYKAGAILLRGNFSKAPVVQGASRTKKMECWHRAERRRLRVSSMCPPRCETSRGRKHRLVFDTTMEDFWLVEYICCSRVLRVDFMQSLLIFWNESDRRMIWNVLVQISLRGEVTKRRTKNVRQWNYIVVNHWDGESSRWINWLIRVLSLSSTIGIYIYIVYD